MSEILNSPLEPMELRNDPRVNFKVMCYTEHHVKVLNGLADLTQFQHAYYWQKEKIIPFTKLTDKDNAHLLLQESLRLQHFSQLQSQADTPKRGEESFIEIPSSKSDIGDKHVTLKLTKIVVHLSVRSRPSIFKKIDPNSLYYPFQSTSTKIKDMKSHFERKPKNKNKKLGYYSLDRTSHKLPLLEEFLYDHLMNGSKSLEDLLQYCREQNHPILFVHILKNLPELVQIEQNSNIVSGRRLPSSRVISEVMKNMKSNKNKSARPQGLTNTKSIATLAAAAAVAAITARLEPKGVERGGAQARGGRGRGRGGGTASRGTISRGTISRERGGDDGVQVRGNRGAPSRGRGSIAPRGGRAATNDRGNAENGRGGTVNRRGRGGQRDQRSSRNRSRFANEEEEEEEEKTDDEEEAEEEEDGQFDHYDVNDGFINDDDDVGDDDDEPEKTRSSKNRKKTRKVNKGNSNRTNSEFGLQTKSFPVTVTVTNGQQKDDTTSRTSPRRRLPAQRSKSPSPIKKNKG